jgi:hypothetical protein
MVNRMLLGGLAALLMAFAGCTGQFEVDQTEPIQVEIDDGDGETVTVRENEEAQSVSFDTEDVEEVEVVVEVTKVSDGPCMILVVVEDDDGNEIVSREIEVGDNMSDENTTTGNETDEDDMEDGDTVIQNIQVDVRGNRNIVVIAESQSGDADVNIAANSSTGTSSQGNTTQGNETDGY